MLQRGGKKRCLSVDFGERFAEEVASLEFRGYHLGLRDPYRPSRPRTQTIACSFLVSRGFLKM